MKIPNINWRSKNLGVYAQIGKLPDPRGDVLCAGCGLQIHRKPYLLKRRKIFFHKQCQSKAYKKFPPTPLPVMAGWNKGINHLSIEARQRIGIAHKGNSYNTPEKIKKLQERMKGNQYWKLVKNRPKGEKHRNWKGGRRDWKKIIYDSSEYKQWRKAVFERDNFICQECKIKNGDGKTVYLQAHHIKPFAFYPELRFIISNGKTLCAECHRKTDSYGRPRRFPVGEGCLERFTRSS